MTKITKQAVTLWLNDLITLAEAKKLAWTEYCTIEMLINGKVRVEDRRTQTVTLI